VPGRIGRNVEITRLVRALFLALTVLVGFAMLWTQHAVFLTAVGGLVVEESPLAKADIVVILGEPPRLAVEAAALVKNGYAPRVVLFTSAPSADDDVVAGLGVKVPRPHEIAVEVLRASGIATARIELLPHEPEGTNDSAQELARYAKAQRVTRVIAVTYRSRTRRTAYLLRRELARSSTVIVRAAARDPFHPESWWRDRAQARELALEGLRWLNSLLLRDVWSRQEQAGADSGRPAWPPSRVVRRDPQHFLDGGDALPDFSPAVHPERRHTAPLDRVATDLAGRRPPEGETAHLLGDREQLVNSHAAAVPGAAAVLAAPATRGRHGPRFLDAEGVEIGRARRVRNPAGEADPAKETLGQDTLQDR